MVSETEPAASVHVPGTRIMRWRKSLRWFLAEFLVVVAGILAALALNSWYQGRQDAGNERDYLQRLSRDLQDTMASLQDAQAFEQKQFDDGISATHALATTTKLDDAETVAVQLTRLASRKTVLLKNATYLDLVNTGNLRLIHDTVLRDHITRFYQDTELAFGIINKNNTSLVDDSYRRQVLVSGLVMPRFQQEGNLPILSGGHAEVTRALGDGFRPPPDRLWSLPPDAPEWAQVRGNLLLRVFVASITKRQLAQSFDEARDLKAAVDAALAR